VDNSDDGWIYEGRAASRLWSKSAIGLQLSPDSILLSGSELLYCSIHRGIDRPEDDWLEKCIEKDNRFLQEFTVLEALRYPGNKIMLFETAEKMGQIKCILFDVDGVFTDGTILRDAAGVEQRRFSVIDGHGVQLLRESGLLVGIVSREASEITRARMEKLKISELHVGVRDKSLIVQEIRARHGLREGEVAFMGDDLPDLSAFSEVGLRLAPRNAQPRVRIAADWVSRSAGGSGAVREAVEVILSCRG